MITNTKDLKTIFLIDDDPVMNYINNKIISSAYTLNLVEFTNAREALEKLKQYDCQCEVPEVIFLDLNMPFMDGWEFLDEFQKLSEDVHLRCNVIILSSSINNRDIERSRGYASVIEFISKPLTVEALSVFQKVKRCDHLS